MQLTQSEQYLLGWLGAEDYSQYGECKCAAFDGLLEKGLVQIHDGGEHQGGFISQGSTRDHLAVSLTNAGRDAYRQNLRG